MLAPAAGQKRALTTMNTRKATRPVSSALKPSMLLL
jgi:hypothetical protein